MLLKQQYRGILKLTLIGCTWVHLGLEVASWRRNIPMSSVDLAGFLLPRHLRQCCLAAEKIAVCDRRVQSKYSELQSARGETRLSRIRILSGRH